MWRWGRNDALLSRRVLSLIPAVVFVELEEEVISHEGALDETVLHTRRGWISPLDFITFITSFFFNRLSKISIKRSVFVILCI